ncbi:MAG TPA: hypothetical protein VKS01_10340, partial [Bryobacteraceae bacterium]|nr:hypothetical protein [Bryobacteraceae bacterium]
MKTFRVILALVCAASAGFAVDTKFWQQTEMADFEKGTLTHLSLSSEGRLTLAPAVKEIYDPAVTFLWAIARDSKGNLYTGGGSLGASKSKLIEIEASGQARTLAELDGMAIQAIAIDKQDRVYAATAPDGKVYRVDAAGKAAIFFDPKAKYIWALEFSPSGDLFVATGDQGIVYRVTPAGAGSQFFKTEETHARSLAMDAQGNLIIGTDPSGLIVRVTPNGTGFVLYQAPKREITAVAVAPDGSIYAAGSGTKTASSLPPPAQAADGPPAPSSSPGAAGTLTIRPIATPPPPSVTPGAGVSGGSEIYRIQADGYPRKVWSDSAQVVYAIAFDGRGRAMAGTGNHGTIYRIDSDHSYTKLTALEPTQVTGFCGSPEGRIYAVTGNIGKVYAIGPQLESSGVFESEVFDAGAFTYWGRVSSEPAGGTVEFETRSGNVSRTQQAWSAWAKLNLGRVVSPAARFLQYRATLSGGSGGAVVSEVDVAYLMKNVAPAIEQVEITPENYKFPAPVAPVVSSGATLTLPPLGRNRPTPAGGPISTNEGATSVTMNWAKGTIGARWLASDDNGDTLSYKVEIRGVNETEWKLLKDKIRDRYYSWDSTAFPDGKYVVRVTATDAPSNPPDQALSASLESDPFLI